MDKTILALIPARGGSKGIKKKNIVPLAGKPLIAYSIEAALKSQYIDRTIVSTDSGEIAKAAEEFGAEAPFLRPKELADDKSKTLDAVLHAVKKLEDAGERYDVLVLLQPTQPLRRAEDIDQAVEVFFQNNQEGLASVSLVDDHPLLIRSIDGSGILKPLLDCGSTCRRQDMPDYYRINGCIYINRIRDLCTRTSFNDNMVPYVMQKEHSVDIDEMIDLVVAQFYLKVNNSPDLEMP